MSDPDSPRENLRGRFYIQRNPDEPVIPGYNAPDNASPFIGGPMPPVVTGKNAITMPKEPSVCDDCGEYQDGCRCTPKCERCHDSYALRDGAEPTRWCDECAQKIAEAMMPPLDQFPQLQDAKPIVLFFPTEEDAEEFIQAVQAAKPGMISRKL